MQHAAPPFQKSVRAVGRGGLRRRRTGVGVDVPLVVSDDSAGLCRSNASVAARPLKSSSCKHMQVGLTWVTRLLAQVCQASNGICWPERSRNSSTRQTRKGPQACLQRLPGSKNFGVGRQAAKRLRAAVDCAAAVPVMPHDHSAAEVRLGYEGAVEWQAVVLVVSKPGEGQIVSAAPQSTASLPRSRPIESTQAFCVGAGTASGWRRRM